MRSGREVFFPAVFFVSIKYAFALNPEKHVFTKMLVLFGILVRTKSIILLKK